MPWFYRHRTGRPPHPDVLTPAEWRVLAHLRAGRSNAEIADALSVSVNTVRTHVSSMLSKLDLPDRAALAEWPGEPAEASRQALGRLHLAGPLGWLAGHASWAGRATVGSALVAVGVLFVFALQATQDPGAGAGVASVTPSPTLTGVETPAFEATEVPREQPTASPSPTPPSALHPQLTVGAPFDLPEGVVLYVWGGCTECDTPPTTLRRVERVGGVVEDRVIFERDINTPYINYGSRSGWVRDDAIYVFECSEGYCGGLGERTNDAAITLYRSTDDGETWASLGTQPVEPGIGIAEPDPARWGVAASPRVPVRTATDGMFEVAGVTLDLRAIDDRGDASNSTYAYYAWGPVDVDSSGRIAVRWQMQVGSGALVYISTFDSSGAPIVTYHVPYGAEPVWLDEHRLVATIVYEPNGLTASPDIDYGWIPSVIDLRDGSVRPILDPFEGVATNRNLVAGIRNQ